MGRQQFLSSCMQEMLALTVAPGRPQSLRACILSHRTGPVDIGRLSETLDRTAREALRDLDEGRLTDEAPKPRARAFRPARPAA